MHSEWGRIYVVTNESGHEYGQDIVELFLLIYNIMYQFLVPGHRQISTLVLVQWVVCLMWYW